MAKKESKLKTIAEIIVDRQEEILTDWMQLITKLGGTRTLELMSEDQLVVQAKGLLTTLTTAFNAEQYVTIDTPDFADSVALLQDISASRAEQGFTASETAVFVFSLKDALLKYMQEEISEDPVILNAEIQKMNKIIDNLGLLTFETYAKTREEVILQQSRSLMELSTPVIRVWDQIIMLPIVGVIDTVRATQLMESLLEAIVSTESRVAILDVTGIPIIDTKVAQHLIKTVAAAKMLGAEVIITGISSDAAQTMTKLEIDISNVKTRGSLRIGLNEAFNMVGVTVIKK